MIKIIDPLYTNLSQNTLRKNMPVETFDGLNNGNTRKNVTHLEALGRSFDGISAWLNLPPDDTEEGQLRAKYTNLVVKSIANAVNPDHPIICVLMGLEDSRWLMLLFLHKACYVLRIRFGRS